MWYNIIEDSVLSLFYIEKIFTTTYLISCIIYIIYLLLKILFYHQFFPRIDLSMSDLVELSGIQCMGCKFNELLLLFFHDDI